MTIDWTNPSSPISKHFTVKEACLLPSWGVYHIPSAAEQANILVTAAWMDKIREFVGKPISVHCWIRPTSANCPGSPHNGGNYNVAAGSTAPHSAHIVGRAVDWDCGDTCDNTRTAIMNFIHSLGLRMEDRPGSNWVHNDNMPVPPGGHFFFIP